MCGYYNAVHPLFLDTDLVCREDIRGKSLTVFRLPLAAKNKSDPSTTLGMTSGGQMWILEDTEKNDGYVIYIDKSI